MEQFFYKKLLLNSGVTSMLNLGHWLYQKFGFDHTKNFGVALHKFLLQRYSHKN